MPGRRRFWGTHMLRRYARFSPLFLVLLMAISRAAPAWSEESQRPALRAGTLPLGYRCDGLHESDLCWAHADSISDLTTVEPEEGKTPAGRTVVRVLANENEVVVGVRCYDPDPKDIVSFSKARDSD